MHLLFSPAAYFHSWRFFFVLVFFFFAEMKGEKKTWKLEKKTSPNRILSRVSSTYYRNKHGRVVQTFV